MSEDPLWDAVSEACAPVANYESEWDVPKLEKKMREYFRKGSKTLEFHSKSWQALINDYADNVFGALFQALSDREWLSQVDFLLVMDAGIKDSFPPRILANVPQQAFERAVLGAHDRAFEEQRYLPILWETVHSVVTEGKSARKKAYDAADNGRKDAAASTDAEAPDQIREFVERWIDASISRLAKSTQGYPESLLPEPVARQLFEELIQNGALPLPLVQQAGRPPPKNWFVVKMSVAAAYARYGDGGEQAGGAVAAGMTGYGGQAKGRGRGAVARPIGTQYAARGMGKPSVHPMGVPLGRGGGAAKGKSKGKTWNYVPVQPQYADEDVEAEEEEEEPLDEELEGGDGAELIDPWGVLLEDPVEDDAATDELTAALAELEESVSGEGPPQKRARYQVR